MAPFTVYLLCYGDFPDLAERSLGSILAHVTPETVDRVVIACNEVSKATDRRISKICYAHEQGPNRSIPLQIRSWDHNAKKYPVMRSLFFDGGGIAPPDTRYVMWFDDDSYIDGSVPDFFVEAALQMADADMIGDRWYMPLRGGQEAWAQAQPWFAGVEFNPRKIPFFTGGWWALRTEVTRKYDWPHAELVHRGGDVMLGMLGLQQRLRLKQWRSGVRINADENGVNSKSPPRGVSISDNANAIGVHYKG